MTLAELVDLEAQLAQDAGEDPERLHARDRSLMAGAAQGAQRRRDQLVSRWLTALRAHAPDRVYPGRRVDAGVRLVTSSLIVAGALLGWGATTVALLFEGRAPVNVWDFLLVFVGAQVALLVLTAVALLVPIRSVGVPLLGLLRALVRRAWRAYAFRAPASAERKERWQLVVDRLKTRHRLYSAVEGWSLVALTQAFAVAFNVGAVLALLRLVVFSDLAFAWATTLDVDAEVFHEAVRVLAAPFGWLVPEAVPSRSLVEATRYSRLEAAYVAGTGAARAGAWWTFLVMSVVTYGLAPRALILVAALARRAYLLSRLPLDDVDVRALLSRLTTPHVTTQADEPEAPGPRLPEERVAHASHLAEPGERCRVVLWRDMPTGGVDAAVRAHIGCDVAEVVEIDGADPSSTERACAALSDTSGPVVIAAEAWEAPDATLMELLTRTRRAVGDRRLVVVLLSGPADDGPSPPDPDDVDVWARRLSRLADPYLAVEPLGGTH